MILNIVLGIIFEKPLVTAKQFIVLLQISLMEKKGVAVKIGEAEQRKYILKNEKFL